MSRLFPLVVSSDKDLSEQINISFYKIEHMSYKILIWWCRKWFVSS